YFGRTGIYELLFVDENIRYMIINNADSNLIRQAARKNGMRILIEDGIEKVKEGVTTLSEVFRVTQEVN
ncbi:MAG: type II secretion system protein GspE, partial [Proteobacteria bacterium]|nr:type II secretion system protein GspE [Pseudomonadota bacterium]